MIQPARLLLKIGSTPAGIAFALDRLPFQTEPLFPDRPAAPGLGMSRSLEWHLASAPGELDEAEAWDLCHRLVQRGMGFAEAPAIQFAEPDLEQRWIFAPAQAEAFKAFKVMSGAACERPDDPNAKYAFPGPLDTYDWRWFQDPDHTGLADARAAIGDPAQRVTIAHLDTGYRKDHQLLPVHLDHSLERSFVKGDANPNSAEDPFDSGFGNNPGHGTGTLGILAGAVFDGTPFNRAKDLIGGAPFAHIIPVRVANSVVLFANSAIARGLQYAIANKADVLSMSMGGVPSQVWADLVNEAYEAGIVLVTAAGNNFGPGPARVPRFIVYPARFHRVLAACGIMSDLKPYADFPDPRLMGGSYGPDSKMDTAMAAFTPNTPWAKYACLGLVDFDGNGTSSATPQIAAAAACFIQQNSAALQALPESWMRVEAVRKALINSANDLERKHFGAGALRADQALRQPVATPVQLDGRKQGPDSVGLPVLDPILHVIFGAAPTSPSQRMLEVEMAQIFTRSGTAQNLLAEAGIDPDHPAEPLSPPLQSQLLEALLDHSSASKALKAALGRASRPLGHPNAVSLAAPPSPGTSLAAENPPVPTPSCRRLRVFAFDPVLGLRVDTESLNETMLELPWEDLSPGPVGENVEVIDFDPSSDACYAPVDLNHPHLLAVNGLAPSEGIPQFHQQMVYAVAMITIGRFEQALGRTAMWAPYMKKLPDGRTEAAYVQRLRIYPHALREANAYYSPDKKSLLFGYFQANIQNAGDNLPGGLIFNCLSHDVIAHETTHALLDGLHRYYREQTNADIAAFHESFADIVALFQHFTIPGVLLDTIARTRGDLGSNNILADIAQQFGQASSGSTALRSALKSNPSPQDYVAATEPHDRGAVLLAAVFQAFLEIYQARTVDLKRLATNGTGVLPPGAISADLTSRLADEAARCASRVLTTCIRALDYCPPVDLTFGDFLRAIVTADLDLEAVEGVNSRTAFISAFRSRGIFPTGVRNLSEEDLRWQPPAFHFEREKFHRMLQKLDLTWDLSSDRKRAYQVGRNNGAALWAWLKNNLTDDEADLLGIDLGVYLRNTPATKVPEAIPRDEKGEPLVQINSVRPARRIGSRGQHFRDLVVEVVQRMTATGADGTIAKHRGGCSLLIDLQNEQIRYAIRKRVNNPDRVAAESAFRTSMAATGQPYFDRIASNEPFAMFHRGM